MPRPRKYANAAERVAAHRLRKKIEKNKLEPELESLAVSIHSIYKRRAIKFGGRYEQMVGKTPFETLLRVVVSEMLFDRHCGEGDQPEFPGWHKLIKPDMTLGEEQPSYTISPGKDSEGTWIYVPDGDSFLHGEYLEENAISNGGIDAVLSELREETDTKKEQM